MSCMFRIMGENLDVDKLLAAIPLRPTMSYRKGEPRFKFRPRGKKCPYSGTAFEVSKAEFYEFEKQKKDAIAFLSGKKAIIRKIMRWPGVDSGSLDFGVEQRDVAVQCDVFPSELLKLAGNLGLDIMYSVYPPSGKE